MELRIGNKRIDKFTEVNIDISYNAIASSFSFEYKFDPSNELHRVIARPGAYRSCQIYHNDQLLLSGQILNHDFNRDATPELQNISGYSIAGVLEDSNVPIDNYPLQHDGKTLREIVDRMLEPFGLQYIVLPSAAEDMDSVLDVSEVNESQSIKGYIAELCAQKDIHLSHDVRGRLVFSRIDSVGRPVAALKKQPPVIDMSLSFNGQAMHSHITVMKQQSSTGGNAGQATVTNPLVGVLRPRVVTQNSGSDVDTELAARNVLADELRNITVSVELSSWDIAGQIIMPGRTITLDADDLYLYRATTFFVESVELTGDNINRRATLNCVLPQVYTGEHVTNIFNT